MPNTFANNSVVSNEVQYMFETANVSTIAFNRQYDGTKVHRGAAEGDIINIEQPFRTVANQGATFVENTIDEYTIPLARATQFQVGLGVTAKELALNLAKKDIRKMYSEKYLKTACATIGAKVDSYALDIAYKNTYNTVGTPGTNPSSYSDITEPRTILELERAPSNDRYAICTPQSIGSLNAGMVSLFNPQKEKSQDYRDGHIGDTNEFRFYSTPNLTRHTNGTCADTTLAVNGTIAEGDTVIPVDGGTANGTITRGTVIKVASVFAADSLTKENREDVRKFVVAEDVTLSAAGAGNITVTVPIRATGGYKHVSALPADGAAITIEGAVSTTYSHNIYMQKDAHVISFVDLPEIGVEHEMMIRNEELGSGFAAKICSDGDIIDYKNRSRLDVLLGVTTPNPWFSVRQWAA
jgi:hypothetical protein